MSERTWMGGAGNSGDGGAGAGSRFGRAQVPRGDGRRSVLGTTLFILGALAILVSIVAQVWTEVMWFDSLSRRSVFTTQLGTQVLLGVVGGLVPAALVWSSLHLGHRMRPIYVPSTPAQDTLDRYREALEPVRRLGTILVPVLVGLMSGLGAAQQWETFLLWRNGQSFGVADPQFGMDIGFFVFTLPWLTSLVGFLTMAFVLAAIAAAFAHYVYGGLQVTNRGRDTTRFALLHLSGLFAVIVLLRAASYWLDRFALSLQTTDLMTGIQYTDANAVLPTKAILAVASIMCALMFLSVIWTRSWRLPVVGTAVLLVTSLVVGGVIPALIQNLRVKPSEQSLEAPYLDRNIKATRAAYGLDQIAVTQPEAPMALNDPKLRTAAQALPGVRIIDPNVVSPTYKQAHALRGYYAFPDALDVDRYVVNGTPQDVVVAARELDLDGVPAQQRNWINDHTVYTHGYGMVVAHANKANPDGYPDFIEAGIPAGKALGEYEPRIYFGEQSPSYSVVGASAGGQPREFDFPAGQSDAAYTYAGSGGVALDSFTKKLAYGIKYREGNFLLSDAVNAGSRLLDYRTPKERVARVAPWLTLDGNVYPSIVDGRVLWIVDGYTTTASYPNSRLISMAQSTSDSITRTRRSVTTLEQGQLNYIRNSVKATVDAFDGTVRLYAWDEDDPLLRAWQAAFPGVVEPRSAMSASLMSHVRYPEDLFKIQRALLLRYHVTEANQFYVGQDNWRVPLDPTQEARVDQPAYYLSLGMPGQSAASFSLTTTFMPAGDRNVLTGFLAVDSNAGSAGDGKVRDGYGAMRLLTLPADSNINGPGQVFSRITQAGERSRSIGDALNLQQFIANARSQNSLVYGNLLTLPLGGSVLNVLPIYLQGGSTNTPVPLSKVIVAVYGDRLAWASTLDGAITELFSGTGGSSTPTPTPSPTPPTSGPTKPPTTGPTSPPTNDPGALAKAIADAQAAYAEGEQALKDGDFAKYGEAQRKLKEALARAAALAPAGSISLPVNSG